MVMWNFSTTFVNDTIDSIAIGGFDGIHLAHQKLISHLSDNGALFVVDRKHSSLTPFDTRQKYTDKAVVNCDFELIKNLDAKEFVQTLKRGFPKLTKIVVGYDFHFAKGRSCNHECLKEYFDGKIVVVDEVCFDGVSIHSSTIRELIKSGKIEMANRLLGRDYTISGAKIKGQGLGSKLFVPTINLEVKSFTLPKEGVYASFSNGYKSISFLGHRVSTDGSFAIESHILEPFCESEFWDISFERFVRDNMKFDSFEELREQIRVDINER